jgi:hypothetical protein
VPPGESNFREDGFEITVPTGTITGAYPFTITATSTADGSVQSVASGVVVVVHNGVRVSLTPAQGAPGGTFQLTVTNTGTVTDTFSVALAAPAALATTFKSVVVTLPAGGSHTYLVQLGGISFAEPGSLPLIGYGISHTNSAIRGMAQAAVQIPETQALSATLKPPSQTLKKPGAAAFMVQVNNLGNTEDAYSATIVGKTGRITANLVGLDGQPTQQIDLFRLPGLFQGELLLQTHMATYGTGTVTIRIQSLTNPKLYRYVTAIVTVAQPLVAVSPLVVQAYHPLRLVQVAPGEYSGYITLLNVSTQPLTGPFEVVLTNLADGVQLVNASGYTSAGAPYVIVNLAALQPNVAVRVPVLFTDVLAQYASTFYYGFGISLFRRLF